MAMWMVNLLRMEDWKDDYYHDPKLTINDIYDYVEVQYLKSMAKKIKYMTAHDERGKMTSHTILSFPGQGRQITSHHPSLV